MQWIEYSILPDIFTEYYQVSYSAISWTTMLFSLTMVVFLLRVQNYEKCGLKLPQKISHNFGQMRPRGLEFDMALEGDAGWQLRHGHVMVSAGLIKLVPNKFSKF